MLASVIWYVIDFYVVSKSTIPSVVFHYAIVRIWATFGIGKFALIKSYCYLKAFQVESLPKIFSRQTFGDRVSISTLI